MFDNNPKSIHLDQTSRAFTEVLGTNRLEYNSVMGVISSQGATTELESFLSSIRPHHVNTFLGGTLTIQKLDAPLIVYRTGSIGKFWTTTPPFSPRQHALDMAMSHSIYPESMKLVPNFHPANHNVLMYQIPAGQIIACGSCAPLGECPGMGVQIYISGVDVEKVRVASWGQWIDQHRSPLAYTKGWSECRIDNLRFCVENTNAQAMINGVVPRISRNASTAVQSILTLARTNPLSEKLHLYAFDLANIQNDAAAMTYYFNDGSRKILLQAQDSYGLYGELCHELTHATLPLASYNSSSDPLYQCYAPKIRGAICTDYWDFKKTKSSAVPIERKVANWIFTQPQSYPKTERLGERLAFTVQGIAESEKAVKRVAPRTYDIVTEYIAEQTFAAVTTSKTPFCSSQSVKIFDVKHQIPTATGACRIAYRNQHGLIEMTPPTRSALTLKVWDVKTNPALEGATYSTMNWRPGFTAGRRAPWYQAVNYSALGRLSMTAITPVLGYFDANSRLKHDRLQFPNASETAHYAAVVTDMGIDYGLFAGLTSLTSAGFAMPVMALANFGCEIANGIRDVPPESMRNNRDFLLVNMDACEFSPVLQKILLDDFDRGGSLSRDFNYQAAQVTKLSYKPFEWAYDIKKGITTWARDLGGSPSAKKASTPATNTPNQQESHQPNEVEMVDVATAIDKHLDDQTSAMFDLFKQVNPVPSYLAPAPNTLGSPNLQSSYHGGKVDLLESTAHQLTLNIGMGSSVMTPDLHQFLLGMNDAGALHVDVEPVATIPYIMVEPLSVSSSSPSKRRANENKPEVPFISNVRLGPVGDKMGLVATVAGAATVGVTASQDGFLVLMTADFGPQFWSALGAGVGVGAVVAGVLLAAKYFCDKHQKHISHKINKGIQHTNKDGQQVTEGLASLYRNNNDSKDGANLQSLIMQSEGLMAYIQSRIKKENERAKYAKSHGSKEGKEAHQNTANSYTNIIYDLFLLTKALKIEQMQMDFIKIHLGATSDEIITLAKTTITKFSTQEEAKAASEEKEKNRLDVLNEVDYLSVYKYKFYKHWDGDTHGDPLSVAEAKQHILSGGTIEAKRKKDKKWLGLPAAIYSDADVAQIKGLRILIVSAVLKLAEQGNTGEAMTLLDETKLLHQFGAETANLNLLGLSNLLQQWSVHLESPPSYWINELNTRSTESTLSEEETLLLKGMASHYLINHVMSNAIQGKFETTKAILVALQKAMPELNDTALHLLAKIEQLRPHLKDIDYCLQQLGKAKLSATDSKAIEDVFEVTLLKFVIKKNIFSLVAEGEFSSATSKCAEYKTVSPDSAETIDEYVAGIEKLKALKGKSNQVLFVELESSNAANPQSASKKEGLVFSTIMTWVYSNIYQNVLNGKKDEAIQDLTTLKTHDPSQENLSDRLIAKIQYGTHHSDKGEDFWLADYERHLELNKALPSGDTGTLEADTSDPHAETVNTMGKMVAASETFTIVGDKGKRGFNREAANIIERLLNIDNTLKINELKEDLRFAHQEQVIGVFSKPVQAMALRFIRGYQPSIPRSAALGALDLVNTLQIVIPNGLSIGLQALHAKCIIKNECAATRSFTSLLSQVYKDINPFSAEFNPFNTENYCNGAMIYTQLFLKGVEYVPLKWFVSDRQLYNAESLRSSVLSYVGMGVRGVSVLTTGMQIKSAMALKDGLFSLANSPFLLVSLANTGVDIGYWAHHKYKLSRGEAIEDPSHYLVQEGVGSGLDTLGSFIFMGMITGGFGWLTWAAGALSGGSGVHHYHCEATRRDMTSKSLIAACSNITYHRNLQASLQYIDAATYKLIQQAPTEAGLAKVRSRADILFRKEANSYSIYFAAEDNKAPIRKKIPGDHQRVFSEGDWPAASEITTLTDEYDLAKMKYIAKDIILNEPIMKEYTANVPYRLLKGCPKATDLELIIRGEEIVFSEETSDQTITYYIYIKNQTDGYDRISIAERLPCFDLLLNSTNYQALPTDAQYREMSEFATATVIAQRLKDSNRHIKSQLESVFGGLCYVNDNPDQEAANFARIMHLYQQIKDNYDQKNHDAVIDGTTVVGHDGHMVMNNIYRLPPHLAWQMILCFRFTTLIESPNRLSDFRNEFQAYSKYIYDAAKKSKPWYCTHWETVKKSLEQMVEYAMQQFIVAANNATAKKDKLHYLSFITKSYNYCSNDWSDILKSDELKFWAASIYYSLDEKEQCELFLRKIKDLSSLIRTKNDGDFTENALVMLDDVNSGQHSDILMSAARGDFALKDEMLLQNALSLLDKNKLSLAQRFLDTSREFHGKSTARAYCLFITSHRTDIMGTLNLLLKEPVRTLDFWRILDHVISKCLESTQYAPKAINKIHANAKLWGWRKICLDYIQKFNLSFEYKIQTDELVDYALGYIKHFIHLINQQNADLTDVFIKEQIDEWIELGHQIIRGENGSSLVSEIELLLNSISFSHVDGEVINKYIPFDVPADGDCGFHVFGITRKEGIDLLLKHVKSQTWVSKVLFGDHQRKDIIDILLDDLEFKNNTRYERTQENFVDNLARIEAYLHSLLTPGVYLPHNQKAASVMDALALLLSKNLRVFMPNERDELSISSSTIHDPNFETMDVLFISAKGYSHKLTDLNHYTRLRQLPTRITEMTAADTPKEDSSSPSPTAPAHGRVSNGGMFKSKTEHHSVESINDENFCRSTERSLR